MNTEPKTCIRCGAKFIPTDGRQKLCPDCKDGKSNPKYNQARKPGEVKIYKMETPEAPAPEVIKAMTEPALLFEAPQDFVPVSDAPPLMARVSALKVIEKLLPEKDCEEAEAYAFLERVRGALALVKEMEE